MPDDEGLPLAPISELAKLTGESIETLRSRAQDGRLPGAKRDNRGRWLVPLPPGITPRKHPGSAQGAELQGRLAAAEEAVERLRAELEVARVTAGRLETERDGTLAILAEVRGRAERAEGEARGLREETVALRERLARMEGEAAGREAVEAELRAALAELRRPWWRRWLG